MVPPKDIQDVVNFYLAVEAENQGISADSLTTEDLQLLAYALRLMDLKDEDRNHYLRAAQAIDGLSELGARDIAYLERVAGTSVAA